MVLVVDGTLRISGRDALGQPCTLRRVHPGEWWGLWSGLSGVSAATRRTTEVTKVLAPIEIWQGWCEKTPALLDWLESHPQREDLYAALRPLLAQRPRQDRSFLDEIDQLQSVLRTVQCFEPDSLQELKAQEAAISWLIPSPTCLVPGIETLGVEGLTLIVQSAQRSLFCDLFIPQQTCKNFLRALIPPLRQIQLPSGRLPKLMRMFLKSFQSGRTLMVKRCLRQPCVRKMVSLSETR